MAAHLFKYIPFTVQQLTTAIDSGALALPDIQRPFVWPQTKVRDLLDSMYRGFPVGQVMFWQTGAEPGVKQIGTDAKAQAVPYHLIVDGQQRLTSLYAVMLGKPVLREDFTEQVIKVAFNPFTEQFAIPDATTAKQVEWLSDITPLFHSFLDTVEGYVEKVRESREVSETERKHLFAVFDRVQDLSGYSFSVVELDANADEEQVAEVFVRINSEGVVLNQADFILTLMSVFWEKGRRQLEDFARDAKKPSLSAASPFNWYIHPQPAQMLRVSAAVAFRRAVLKHVYSALRGRDLESGKPDPTKRDAQFARFEAAQDKVLNLTNWLEYLHVLERAGYRGSKMISSENAILYTYALWLIGREECNVPLDRLRGVMARWFFMSSITARYSGSFESQMEKDLALLKDVTTADQFCAAIDKVVTDTLTADFWAITLPNELGTSASKSPALLSYIAALNILDADPLLSTGKVRSWLDPAITAKKGIERHHLFPKQYLRKHLGVTDTKSINQIANMALVEWSDNIKISDQPPAEYWPQQVADKSTSAGLTPDRLERQERWHALPPGWQTMDYEDFLTERRRLMAGVVKDAYALLAAKDYAPEYPEPMAETLPSPAEEETFVSGTSLHDLVQSGAIAAGTVLLPARDDTEGIPPGSVVAGCVDDRGDPLSTKECAHGRRHVVDLADGQGRFLAQQALVHLDRGVVRIRCSRCALAHALPRVPPALDLASMPLTPCSTVDVVVHGAQEVRERRPGVMCIHVTAIGGPGIWTSQPCVARLSGSSGTVPIREEVAVSGTRTLCTGRDELERAVLSIDEPALYTHVGWIRPPSRRTPILAAYVGESCMEGPFQSRPVASLREQQGADGFKACFTLVTVLPPEFKELAIRLIAEAQCLADLGDVLRLRNTQIGAETQITRVLHSGRAHLVDVAGQVGRAHAAAVMHHLDASTEVYLRGGRSVRERYLWTARSMVGPLGGVVDLYDVAGLLRARDPERWAKRARPSDPLRRDFAVREGRALPFPRARYLPIGRAHINPWPLDAAAAVEALAATA